MTGAGYLVWNRYTTEGNVMRLSFFLFLCFMMWENGIADTNDSIAAQDDFLARVEAVSRSFTDTIESSDYAGDAMAQQVGVVGLVVRIVLYLFVFVIVALVVVWLLRGRRFSAGGAVSAGAMDILEVQSTGQGRAVVLVRIQDSVYVVGQTPSSMSCMGTIQGDKALEIIASSRGGVSMISFREAFNSFMGRSKKS